MATLAPGTDEASRAVSLTLRAALLTAIADALYGIVQYRVAEVPSPVTRFFLGIASVPLGKRPDDGDGWAVALGVLLHFAVACFWAGLFALLLARSSRLARLLATPGGTLLAATAYGPLIWTCMSVLVIAPLLRRPPTFDLNWWIMCIGHIAAAGVPIAFTLRPLRTQWHDVPRPRAATHGG